MMVLPSGIKVFWPLMTCTPRLKGMFGDDETGSLIYLHTLKIVCFGIGGGGEGALLSHCPPLAYLGTFSVH